MKYFFIIFILLFTLNACQDKAEDAKIQEAHDAKIIAQERARVLAEFNAKQAQEAKEAEEKAKVFQEKPQSTLKQLGINIQGETIVIDGNQSKQFFNTLKDKMHTQIQKISHDVKIGVGETQKASIALVKEHIDINKTKNLLDTWNTKIEDFVQEFDTKVHTIETNTSKGN